MGQEENTELREKLENLEEDIQDQQVTFIILALSPYCPLPPPLILQMMFFPTSAMTPV
jgi:hypothetical protein